MIVPLDELLALPAGLVTPSLANRSMQLSTHMGFADLEEQLLSQHNVRLTDTTLDALMRKVGGVAEADWQAQVQMLEALPRGVAREEKLKGGPAPSRLHVSCDGIIYRTCYRQDDPENPGKKRLVYQEMKVGAVFWQDSKSHWHKRVVCGRDEPESFGLRLWKLAVECGLLTCPEVIFISDGGGWCGTVAESYFKDATRILDWYHLSEYVWKAGRGLYPGQDQPCKRWVDDCLDHLHDAGGEGLLAHLQRCQTARGGQTPEAFGTLVGYLSPRLSITRYPSYRARGLIIGSGMMESSCKQVVGQRLKGPGMEWSEQGALAMANLVTHRINGTWDAFWATKPLRRAA
jgi:hypothetical protein